MKNDTVLIHTSTWFLLSVEYLKAIVYRITINKSGFHFLILKFSHMSLFRMKRAIISPWERWIQVGYMMSVHKVTNASCNLIRLEARLVNSRYLPYRQQRTNACLRQLRNQRKPHGLTRCIKDTTNLLVFPLDFRSFLLLVVYLC